MADDRSGSRDGGKKKGFTPVTDNELKGLSAGFAEQLIGGYASAWGHQLGQMPAIRAFLAQMSKTPVGSALTTLGLAGMGAALSNQATLGAVLRPMGVPEEFIAFAAENVGDVTEGLQAARFRNMSRGDAQKTLDAEAQKKIEEFKRKLEAENYQAAKRVLSPDQRDLIDRHIRSMTPEQSKEWQTVSARITNPVDLSDALRNSTDATTLLAYIARNFPAKAPSRAASLTVSAAKTATDVALKAFDGFIADPAKSLGQVAKDIDAETAKIEAANALREAELEKKRNRR